MAFAPLTAILIENYGWKGAHLVFGGFCLASIFFAALMGPFDKKCHIRKGTMRMVNQKSDKDIILSTYNHSQTVLKYFFRIKM